MIKRYIFIIFVLFVFFPMTAAAEERLERVDFEDAAALDVVKILAAQAGLDLVVSGNNALAQARRSTVHLRNVSPQEAIDHILQTSGLSCEKKGNSLLVSVSAQEQPQGEIEAIKLKYLNAERAIALLCKILPDLKATAGESSNSLVLRGKTNDLNEARKIIASVDKPVPQILIESKVVEISSSDSMRLGISYGKDPGSYKFITDWQTKTTSPADDLQTTLNAMITDGSANVVANPKIATLDDHEAVINIGSRIPYAVPVSNGSSATQWTVEYIDAGVCLKITPQLGRDGYITTFIQPEVSSISEWRSTAAGEFPVITTRNARATLRVRDGETIVVGGLLSEAERENFSRVPVLGYLPVVGMLFQNKNVERSKTEIVFFITPHII